MLCLCWNQKGVLYYELLKPSETINGGRCRQQLIKLKRAIARKRLEFATTPVAIFFHHYNDRSNVASPGKRYLESSGLKGLLIRLIDLTDFALSTLRTVFVMVDAGRP